MNITTLGRAPRHRAAPTLFLAVALLAAAACADRLPTTPDVQAPTLELSGGSVAVADGAHGGNASFWFLPPLVSNPAPDGVPDTDADPTVTICAWTGSACAGVAATWSRSSGSDGETVRLGSDGAFAVNWRTDELDVPGATVYRIAVRLGATEVGHADVELVSGGAQLNSSEEDAPIALKDGRTLPIRFLILEGNAPPTLSARDEREGIASGGNHTCAITAAGETRCWGSNQFGEAGIGATGSPSEVGQLVTGGHAFGSLVAGIASTCGLDASGLAWCWGANDEGQLGVGYKSANVPAPTAVLGGHTFEALSAGAYFVCGRTPAGEVWCWGYGPTGALGNGGYVSATAPVKVAAPGDPTFTRVEAGGGHACALDDSGAAWCWGMNTSGELGRGATSIAESVPAPAAVGHAFTQLAASGQYTCGLESDGTAVCWGQNGRGQLGRGSLTGPEPTPAPVSGAHAFVRLAAGLQHACGQTVLGEAWCWGSNDMGQIGTGALGPSPDNAYPIPEPVAEGANWPALAPGWFHTCAVAFDGTARCWGWNLYRQVGTASPVLVPAHTTVAVAPLAVP